MDPRVVAAQRLGDDLAHHRVQVHRVHDLDVLVTRDELAQRRADSCEPVVEVLAPVPGDEHQAPLRVEDGEALGVNCFER